MGKVKFKGIRSEEILDCGCILKRYISGLNVIDTEDNNPQCTKHIGFKEYECRSCGKKFQGKKPLKQHRWEHAL